MSKENINSMISLCFSKKKMLKMILNLTTEQRDLIEGDNLDKLEDILLKKQEIMEEVDKVDIQFLKLFEIIKSTEEIETIDKINIDKYSNIRALKEEIHEINLILKEIQELDINNTSKMQENIRDLKLEIRNVKKGKLAYKGYNKDPELSILIDEKK